MKRAFDIASGIFVTAGGLIATFAGAAMAVSNPIGLATAAGVGVGAAGLIVTRLGWRAIAHGTDPASGTTTSLGRTLDVAGGVILGGAVALKIYEAATAISAGALSGGFMYAALGIGAIATALHSRLAIKSITKGTGPSAPPSPAAA